MQPPQFLATFNQPSPKVLMGRRDKTNSPAQALALLNDPFVESQAEFWAKKLISQPHHDPQERIDAMFRRAFSRKPDDAELERWTKIARDFAARQQDTSSHSPIQGDLMKSLDVWKNIAHTMFNAKEFIYVR